MAVNCFKQALHLRGAITKKHGVNIVGVTKVRNVDARTSLNPWVALQGSIPNPVNNVADDGR